MSEIQVPVSWIKALENFQDPLCYTNAMMVHDLEISLFEVKLQGVTYYRYPGEITSVVVRDSYEGHPRRFIGSVVQREGAKFLGDDTHPPKTPGTRLLDGCFMLVRRMNTSALRLIMFPEGA